MTPEHAGLEAVVARNLEEQRLPLPSAVAIGIATPVVPLALRGADASLDAPAGGAGVALRSSSAVAP